MRKTEITKHSLEDEKLKNALNNMRQRGPHATTTVERDMPLMEIFNMLDDILDAKGNPVPMLDDSNNPMFYRTEDAEGKPTGNPIQLFHKLRSSDADRIIKDIPGDFGAFIDRRVDRRAMWCLEPQRIGEWFDAVCSKLDFNYIRLVDNQKNAEAFEELMFDVNFGLHEQAISREINEWRTRAEKNKTSPYIGKNRYILAIPENVERLAKRGTLQNYAWSWKYKVYTETGPINRMQLIDIYRIEKSNYKDTSIQELLGHPGPMATFVCKMSEDNRPVVESLWSTKKIMKDDDRAFNAKAIQLMNNRIGLDEREKLFMNKRFEITSPMSKCLQSTYDIFGDWFDLKKQGKFTDLELAKTDGAKLLLVGLMWQLGDQLESFHCKGIRKSEIVLTAYQNIMDNVVNSGKNYGFNSRDDAVSLKQCMSGGISNERDITVRVDENPLASTITRVDLLKVSKKVPQNEFLIRKTFELFYEKLKSYDDEFLITANRNEPDKCRNEMIERDAVDGGVMVRITEKRINSKNEIVTINNPDTSTDPIVANSPRYPKDSEYVVVPREEMSKMLVNGEHVVPYSHDPTQTSIDGFEFASAQFNKEKSDHRLIGEKSVLAKIKARGEKYRERKKLCENA
jgi:hypothetical protein